MKTFRGKLVLAGVFKKLMNGLQGGKKGEKKKAMGFEINEDMMKMMGGFTVLRLTNLMGAANLKFTKEDLLKMNKELNRIRKPKKLR
jgi:beta-galactosidase